MASVISSQSRNRLGPVDDFAAFRRKLARVSRAGPVPLLVLRIVRLECEGERGRTPAETLLQRRCLRAFARAQTRVLRGCDLLAYDGGAHLLVGLVAPSREALSVAAPSDCRATLVRLSAAIEVAIGIAPESGWTMLAEGSAGKSLQQAIGRALDRGAGERERNAFFNSIGHELRTPLTSIRGYLETLLDEELDAETARRFLETAQAEAARMGRLVDGLHDLSVREADARQTDAEQGELLAALTAALNAVAPFAAARRTVISQLASESFGVLLSTDRLTQIIVNVLENSVKHGREAGRVFVSVSALDERYVEVCVDDDGPGVPVNEREAIFLLARRGANVRARGNGLGLALVRLTLERVGGEVDVHASPLGGARFRLRVPRTATAPQAPKRTSPAGAPRRQSVARASSQAAIASKGAV
jgi:signal transduction histidine kinase